MGVKQGALLRPVNSTNTYLRSPTHRPQGRENGPHHTPVVLVGCPQLRAKEKRQPGESDILRGPSPGGKGPAAATKMN